MQVSRIHTKPLFVQEVEIDFDGSIVRLTGIMTCAEDDDPTAVAHLFMSDDTFRQLLAHGRRKLARMAN